MFFIMKPKIRIAHIGPNILFFLFAGRKNNWPPLPGNFPVGPCFYQDFSVDIPVEFQKTVKIMYYLWMCEYKINCMFNRVYVLLSKPPFLEFRY